MWILHQKRSCSRLCSQQECIPVGCILPASVAGTKCQFGGGWPSGKVTFWYWPSGWSCLLLWPSGWKWPSLMAFWLKVAFCYGLLVYPLRTTPLERTYDQTGSYIILPTLWTERQIHVKHYLRATSFTGSKNLPGIEILHCTIYHLFFLRIET